MKHTASMVLAAAAALAFAQSAPAQQPGAPPSSQRAKSPDTDGDGKISRDEAKARQRLDKNFDAIDTDKDGFLSRDELTAARAKAAERKKTTQPATQPPKPQ